MKLIDFSKIIAILGGWTVVIGALFTWVSARISDRLNLKWKNRYDKEIESLKNELSSSQMLLNSCLSTFSTGYQYSQERRLKAIEIIWEVILEIRKYISPVKLFYTILLPTEYNSIFDNRTFMFGFESLSEDKLVDITNSCYEKVEQYRPFLGEELWSLFYIYQIFLSRVTHKLINGIKNQHIEAWYNDNATMQLLKTVLTEKELLSYEYKGLYGFNNIIYLLESKILHIINKQISGELASEEGFSKAQKIIRAINELKDK